MIPPGDLVIKELKTGEDDQIALDDGFLLLSNMWGTKEAKQKKETKQEIRLYTNGSYGWGWRRGNSGRSEPNYPEVIYGVKPWGQGLEGLLLPKQLKDINSLLLELDFDYRVTNQTNTWYVTLEFFLTKEKPVPGKDLTKIDGAVSDEVMIFFDWNDGLDSPQVPGVIEDGAYSYDLFNAKKFPNWDYTQFRIGKKGKIPEKINLKLFLDRIQEVYDRSGDLWLGAVEFGMMYYDQTAGWGLVKKFDLVINGERVSSVRQ